MFEYRYYESPRDKRPIIITHDDCEFFRILGWSDATKESRDISRQIVSIRNPRTIFQNGFDGKFKNNDGTEDTVHFNFLFAGAGDTRKQRALFATDEVRHAVIPYIMNGLTMDDVNTPIDGKYPCSGLRFTTYESLWFTGSRRIDFDIDKCIVIKDVEHEIHYEALKVDAPSNYVSEEPEPVSKVMEITDGAGMFLPGTFQHTAFTARAPWFKGLMVQHDFKAAALRTGNYILKDAWGQDHDIIAEDINCIWTTSQLKLWKAYKNWDHYKRYYKELDQHFCEALTPEEKHELVLSYQPLQSIQFTEDEIRNIMRQSVHQVFVNSGKSPSGKVVNYKETIKVLGVDKMPVFQQLTEPMLNTRYFIERVQEYLRIKVNHLRCGEITLPGYEPFVSPDWNHVCNVLFGDDMPTVPTGNVSCPYFEYGRDCDIIRYPHLYGGGHCLRTNVAVEGLTSDVVYADHDGITAILCEADYDGDHLQMFIEKSFIDVMRKPENQLPPIYYECSGGKKYPVVFGFTPEDEIVYDDNGERIHKHYLFDELVDSYGDKANIGLPSNWATRILNSELPWDQKHRWVMLLAHCVQGRIDRPKTGVSYDIPDELVKEITKLYKLPAMMRLKKKNADTDRQTAKNRGIYWQCYFDVMGEGNFDDPTEEQLDVIDSNYKDKKVSLKYMQRNYGKDPTRKTAHNVMDYIWLICDELKDKLNATDWYIPGQTMFEYNKPTKKNLQHTAKHKDVYSQFIYDCQSKHKHPIWRERINMMTMVEPDPDIQAETRERFAEEFPKCNLERDLFPMALKENKYLSFILYVWPNEFLTWALTVKKIKSISLKERRKQGAKIAGEVGNRERKAEGGAIGGANGSPAKHGKVVKEDTGEVIFEGSYEQCQDYIGMSGNHFAEKADTGKPYKSKKLGYKVLCIAEVENHD